ncbi:hypothetical protein EC9_52600 [Rosistilla ulvae]|uniref:Uncharacterized protein n=1 Tax=Rosistilla ulvae TaxID=1930277 RepID=A0A517M832_9BACT|nr:hypothetical protein EC9_52600 [Rosistilla ulvae]
MLQYLDEEYGLKFSFLKQIIEMMCVSYDVWRSLWFDIDGEAVPLLDQLPELPSGSDRQHFSREPRPLIGCKALQITPTEVIRKTSQQSIAKTREGEFSQCGMCRFGARFLNVDVCHFVVPASDGVTCRLVRQTAT